MARVRTTPRPRSPLVLPKLTVQKPVPPMQNNICTRQSPAKEIQYRGVRKRPKEAARAYDQKAIVFRGEMAKTNFPISEYIFDDAQIPPAAPPDQIPQSTAPLANDCETSECHSLGF
ncbi:hypothetical protein P8452_17176 [Trifolium repens]|nr:hypothetical protein P8452_17176 [Trifolium repens]